MSASPWSSTKRRTFWHISSACLLSALTQATPITADCQRSWSSTSATATLKVLRSRDVSERTTWRLSLSEALSGTWRVTVSVPMTMSAESASREAPCRSQRLEQLLAKHLQLLEVVDRRARRRLARELEMLHGLGEDPQLVVGEQHHGPVRQRRRRDGMARVFLDCRRQRCVELFGFR